MFVQAFLARHCLKAYKAVLQTDTEFGLTLGDDVGLFNSPTELASRLKARLLSHRTMSVNWLALAVAVLEARANA